MTAAPTHPEENARLEALKALSILDSESEKAFDQITRLASIICDVPIALVSLVDAERQWFKSRVGLDVTEAHRKMAFCAHAILESEPLIVEDTLKDLRFRDNPLVVGAPYIRFYAGVPVKFEGLPLGTLCVIDQRPRGLSVEQITLLQGLAAQVESLLESRRALMLLEAQNRALSHFNGIVAHDLQAPLRNIESLSHIVCEDFEDADGELMEMVQEIGERALRVNQMLVDLRKYWCFEQRELLVEEVALDAVVQSVIAMLPDVDHVDWQVGSLPVLEGANIELQQIFLNLINNAVRHNDKEIPQITVAATPSGRYWRVEVSDNGPGLDRRFHARVFEAFTTFDKATHGTGLGLSIVKLLVSARGGEVGVESDGRQGCSFWFTWPMV